MSISHSFKGIKQRPGYLFIYLFLDLLPFLATQPLFLCRYIFWLAIWFQFGVRDTSIESGWMAFFFLTLKPSD